MKFKEINYTIVILDILTNTLQNIGCIFIIMQIKYILISGYNVSFIYENTLHQTE